MQNCYIYEDFYKGQYKKQKYRIWSVMGRESILAYWYVVMFEVTYEKEYGSAHIDLESVDDKITNKAIDIRKLPNYKKVDSIGILYNRKEIIVPIIKEAIQKGYIEII